MQKVAIPAPTRIFYGWYMVAATWAMIFLTNAVAVGIFFKPMLEEFKWDRATLSSVQSIAMLFFAVTSPFQGQFIDRFGPRITTLVCCGTQLLSRVLNGVASNIYYLYFARYFYEVKVQPGAQVLVNRWFTSRRGLAQGILSTSLPLGTLILTPVSQYLILIWGWRQTMFFWAAVTFVIMLPLALMIKDSPGEKNSGPFVGQIAAAKKSVRPAAGSSFLVAVKTRAFWLVSSAHFICGIGCGFMATHIVIFTTDAGFSDMIAASMMSVQGAFNIIGVLATGPLSDRMKRKDVLALTHFVRTLSFAGLILFVLLGSGSLWLLYAAMALFGFGWFTTAPLTANLVNDLFGMLRMGTILGVATAAHIIGISVGAYAGGAIYEMTHSYYWFFVVVTVLSLLATFFSLAIPQKKLYAE